MSPSPTLEDKYAKFLKTEPPRFSNTTDPIEVDYWIKTIERKLDMVQCNDREKTLYASGQLVGAASAWWDSYINVHEQPESIVWKEFHGIFIPNYTPASAMKLKRKELLGLKQGKMTMINYRDKFIKLSKYAPRVVEGDKDKLEQFLDGLNADLQSILTLHEYPSLQHAKTKLLS